MEPIIITDEELDLFINHLRDNESGAEVNEDRSIRGQVSEEANNEGK